MSESSKRSLTESPKTERWVIVMACAFAPMLAALFLPETMRIPLIVIAGMIFVAGFVLMLRASRHSRSNESLRQFVHPGSE